MGLIYSICANKNNEEEGNDRSKLAVEKNTNTNKSDNISLTKQASLEIPTKHKNTEMDYFNFNSEDNKLPHLEYGSIGNSPRFQNSPTKKLILESIGLEEELNNSHAINYDYANNTTVFGRFYNLDDKNFDGSFDDNFRDSFINMEYSKPVNDKDYISISSNSILTDNSRIDYNYDNEEFYDLKNLSPEFLKKNHMIVYFELHYFMLWGIEFIRSVYPEVNLIIFVQLNDDPTTTEKIYLNRTEEKNKYKPLLKKEDVDKKCFRMIKFMMDDNTDNLNRKPIKLLIEICIYSNNKISPITHDEFFFSSNLDQEMHKYQLYPNTYMKYNNKKIGNLYFTFMYKLDRINYSTYEEQKNLSSVYLHIFNKRDKLMTFNADALLQLHYYNVENCQLKSETPTGNFLSLEDIQVVEISAFLKNENVTIDKLLELLSANYITKFEMFEILKKLDDFLAKKEFNEIKLDLFKDKLCKLLEEVKENKECYDKITIPFVFNLLRKTFFKVNKTQKGKDNAAKKKPKGYEELNSQNNVKNVELMIQVFNSSFYFLKPEFGRDIALSALNYIHKNIEENFVIPISTEKRINSEEYFINFILSRKKYDELSNLLLYMSDSSACAHPITMIFTKILKSRKDESKDLLAIIKQDKFREVFKEILKTHDSNSLIMTNIICILYYILDFIELEELFQIITFSKLKEIFVTFKLNGFDLIHESIIYLIKAILVKKSSSQKVNNSISNSTNSNLTDNDYSEMINVFANSIMYIRNKILIVNDFNRLVKSLFGLLSHVYTICNIINNINEKNALKAHQICIEKRMPELLIECLNTLNEKKIFTFLDNGFDKFDTTSVNTKMIIFRTLFHCILLIQNLRKIEEKTITKFAADKLFKIIKMIDDNDNIYNPQEIMKQHEKLNKKMDENFKANLKNLLEYYNRYKQKLPEIVNELKTVIKK